MFDVFAEGETGGEVVGEGVEGAADGLGMLGREAAVDDAVGVSRGRTGEKRALPDFRDRPGCAGGKGGRSTRAEEESGC